MDHHRAGFLSPHRCGGEHADHYNSRANNANPKMPVCTFNGLVNQQTQGGADGIYPAGSGGDITIGAENPVPATPTESLDGTIAKQSSTTVNSAIPK